MHARKSCQAFPPLLSLRFLDNFRIPSYETLATVVLPLAARDVLRDRHSGSFRSA